MARHIPGPLYYEKFGATGRPMVFLHSTPDDLRFWMYQTAHFSSWYQCIAVDAAGYGRSPTVQPGVTIADQAQAHWEVVDRISSEPIVLHGNSMGSIIARYMALQRPGQVAAMILSGVGFSGAANMREVQDRWKKKYLEEGLPCRHFQVLDHMCDAMKKDPRVLHYASMVMELNNLGTIQSIVAMNEAIAACDMGEAVMSKLTCPTLIVSGTLDRSHPGVPALQKAIPGSEVRNMEGAGHANNFEQPWEYDRHCIEWLTKLKLFP